MLVCTELNAWQDTARPPGQLIAVQINKRGDSSQYFPVIAHSDV